MRPLDGQLELKVMAAPGPIPAAADVVPIFHQWIEKRRLESEILIDVADYSHVHQGPGVVLVGHERSYSLGHGQGGFGLTCRQKHSAAKGTASLRRLFQAALTACRLLEEEPGARGLKFSTADIRLRVLDRLRAPGGRETASGVMPELDPFLRELYAGASRIRVRVLPKSKEPFEVRVEIEGAPAIEALASRLASE